MYAVIKNFMNGDKKIVYKTVMKKIDINEKA